MSFLFRVDGVEILDLLFLEFVYFRHINIKAAASMGQMGTSGGFFDIYLQSISATIYLSFWNFEKSPNFKIFRQM